MEDNKVIKFNINYRRKHKEKGDSRRGYALFNEGLCFYRQNKDDLALDKFLASENEGYESSDMLAFIAWIYGSKSDYDKSIEYAQKSLDMDSENGFAYSIIASCYYHLEDKEKCLEYGLKAFKYDCDDDATMCRQISEMYNSPEINNHLKSLEYAQKAIEIAPKHAFSWYWKGWIYYTKDDFKNALKYYLKSESLGLQEHYLYFEISYCYSMLDNLDKALEYANKSIFLEKEYYLGYYRKGFAYFLVGQEKQAKESFLQAEKLGFEDVEMYSKLCFIYAQEDNIDKALEYANKAIKYEKRNPEGYYFRAHVYSYKLHDYKNAVKNYKKAYDLYLANGDCMNNEAYNHYVCALNMYGRYKRALKLVEEALEAYPDDVCLLESKISVLQMQRNYDEAAKVTQKLVELDPDSCWTKYAQGVVFYNKRKCKDKDFEKVLEYIEPLDSKEINELGGRNAILSFCYYELKDYEKSLEHMCKFVKIRRLKEFILKNGKEVKRYYMKLLKKFPDDKRMDFISKMLSEYIN